VRNVRDPVEDDLRAVAGPGQLVDRPDPLLVRQGGPVARGRTEEGDLRDAVLQRDEGDRLAIGRDARREDGRRATEQQLALPVFRRRVGNPCPKPPAGTGPRHEEDETRREERQEIPPALPGRGQPARRRGHGRGRRRRRGRPRGDAGRRDLAWRPRGRHRRPGDGDLLDGRQIVPELLQLPREVPGRRVPLVRVLRQEPGEDPENGRRDARIDPLDRLGILLDDRGERLDDGRPVEGLPPGQHLVEDQAERELVRPAVERLAGRLLRGHVARRPDDEARVRQMAERPRLAVHEAAGQLRDAEVEDLHEAVPRHHDVVGLQVAVDDPGLVSLCQPVREL
jgi:hypothetical protein